MGWNDIIFGYIWQDDFQHFSEFQTRLEILIGICTVVFWKSNLWYSNDWSKIQTSMFYSGVSEKVFLFAHVIAMSKRMVMMIFRDDPTLDFGDFPIDFQSHSLSSSAWYCNSQAMPGGSSCPGSCNSTNRLWWKQAPNLKTWIQKRMFQHLTKNSKNQCFSETPKKIGSLKHFAGTILALKGFVFGKQGLRHVEHFRMRSQDFFTITWQRDDIQGGT